MPKPSGNESEGGYWEGQSNEEIANEFYGEGFEDGGLAYDSDSSINSQYDGVDLAANRELLEKREEEYRKAFDMTESSFTDADRAAEEQRRKAEIKAQNQLNESAADKEVEEQMASVIEEERDRRILDRQRQLNNEIARIKHYHRNWSEDRLNTEINKKEQEAAEDIERIKQEAVEEIQQKNEEFNNLYDKVKSGNNAEEASQWKEQWKEFVEKNTEVNSEEDPWASSEKDGPVVERPLEEQYPINAGESQEDYAERIKHIRETLAEMEAEKTEALNQNGEYRETYMKSKHFEQERAAIDAFEKQLDHMKEEAIANGLNPELIERFNRTKLNEKIEDIRQAYREGRKYVDPDKPAVERDPAGDKTAKKVEDQPAKGLDEDHDNETIGQYQSGKEGFSEKDAQKIVNSMRQEAEQWFDGPAKESANENVVGGFFKKRSFRKRLKSLFNRELGKSLDEAELEQSKPNLLSGLIKVVLNVQYRLDKIVQEQKKNNLPEGETVENIDAVIGSQQKAYDRVSRILERFASLQISDPEKLREKFEYVAEGMKEKKLGEAPEDEVKAYGKYVNTVQQMCKIADAIFARFRTEKLSRKVPVADKVSKRSEPKPEGGEAEKVETETETDATNEWRDKKVEYKRIKPLTAEQAAQIEPSSEDVGDMVDDTLRDYKERRKQLQERAAAENMTYNDYMKNESELAKASFEEAVNASEDLLGLEGIGYLLAEDITEDGSDDERFDFWYQSLDLGAQEQVRGIFGEMDAGQFIQFYNGQSEAAKQDIQRLMQDIKAGEIARWYNGLSNEGRIRAQKLNRLQMLIGVNDERLNRVLTEPNNAEA